MICTIEFNKTFTLVAYGRSKLSCLVLSALRRWMRAYAVAGTAYFLRS